MMIFIKSHLFHLKSGSISVILPSGFFLSQFVIFTITLSQFFAFRELTQATKISF
jgi:uncharacterized membrane protein